MKPNGRPSRLLARLIVTATVLSGCDDDYPKDQCVRAEVFKACMASLEKQIDVTGNMIAHCADAAEQISRRAYEQIKDECRSAR